MRTIAEIYDQIIEEKDKQNSLADLAPFDENFDNFLTSLNSASKVAVWRLWAYLISVAIFMHEKLFEIFKIEVQSIADSAPAGTVSWYQKMMLKFQLGDTLEYINNEYKYADIDSDKMIVKRCAIEERPDGVVLVKAAKEDSSTGPVPLDLAEKSALTSYAHKVKFAGTRLAVLSIPGDTLTIHYDIYYDPIIAVQTLQESIDIAMKEHIENLPFNAVFNVTKFTDTLQSVTGVRDPIFKNAINKPSGGQDTPFEIEILPASGWFEFSDSAEIMFNFIQKI